MLAFCSRVCGARGLDLRLAWSIGWIMCGRVAGLWWSGHGAGEVVGGVD